MHVFITRNKKNTHTYIRFSVEVCRYKQGYKMFFFFFIYVQLLNSSCHDDFPVAIGRTIRNGLVGGIQGLIAHQNGSHHTERGGEGRG